MGEAARLEEMFPGKPLLNPEEVARFLDFSRKRVYALTAAGVFRPPLVEKMGALLLFRKALLADFVEGRPLPAAEVPSNAPQTALEAPAVPSVKRGRGRPRKSSLCAFAAHPFAESVLAACDGSDVETGGGPMGYWTRRGKVVGRVSGSQKAVVRALRDGLRLAVATPADALLADWTDTEGRGREVFSILAASPALGALLRGREAP